MAPAWAAERLQVKVEGLSRQLRANVVASLSIAAAVKEKDLDEGRIRRLHAQAPAEIAEALQPFGYYRPQVQSSLDRQDGTWVARYQVGAGPVIKVAHTDVALVATGTAVDDAADGASAPHTAVEAAGTAAADPGFAEAVASFPLKPGDPLVHADYERGKAAFDDYAASHGYLDAAFEVSEIRVDLAAYSADIVLHYRPGPRYRFGETVVHQNFLVPGLVAGYITWKQGEPLSTDELLKVQTALSSSPYFARVEVVPRRPPAGAPASGLELPIDVELTPAKRTRWTAGLGYGTDTGPRGNAGLEIRRVNRRGHRADAETRLSEIEKSFAANYEIPGAYPRTDVLTFSLGYADLHPATSSSRSFLSRVAEARSFGRWRQTVALDFQRTDFEVGVDSGVSRLLTPQATWSRVFADDPIYPSHGERLEFSLRGASDSVLSNATYVQGKAKAKFIQSFADRRFRFLGRGELGYTETSQFRQLPPTVRFFAGGDQSVRGYAYQALGPRDERGDVIGGPALAVASAELEYRFLQKWGVAAFYDMGNAAGTPGDDLKVGTGLGIRWLSPIGLVRVDAAVAVREPGHPIRLHLTLGPDL